MKLSPIQRRNLMLYLRFKDDAPSLRKLFTFNFLRYVPLLTVLAAGIFLLFQPDYRFFGTILVSMLVGALSRDVGFFKRTIRIWPLLREIIDWNRAEELLKQQTPPGRTEGGQE